MPHQNHIAGNIVRARVAAGLSQRRLAKLCGIGNSYLSMIESHRRDPFSGPIELLQLIAKATGTTLEELRNP